MIYTLTLNPALDYMVRLPSLRPGETNRAESAVLQIGGKGINVSCVLKELGVESIALGFVAGFTGEALEGELTRLGVATDFIRLPEGLTRVNVKLGATETHVETEINGIGPTITAEAMEALWAKLDTLTEGDTLVLAGSIPPSLPRDLYGRIAARIAARWTGRGIRLAVDAEGEALAAVLPYSPFLIKPNRAELEGWAGRPLPSEDDLEAAVKALQGAGARNVLVSLGGDGALLLDEYGALHRAKAPAILPVNTVGAGDSMVAGFLAGLAEGYPTALRWGIAAGSATAAAEGLAKGPAIRDLLERMGAEGD